MYFTYINNVSYLGYPRTVSQAEELDRNYNVDMVLNLDVPFETITDRISVSNVTTLQGCLFYFVVHLTKVPLLN